MAKKKKTEETKVEFWRGRWGLPKDFPEEYVDLLGKRYDVAEAWEADRRKQGPPFNEKFCADVYFMADTITRDPEIYDDTFDPEALYREMCETMNAMRKGKKDYSLYDEVKMVGKVMENHKKKNK